MTTSVFICIACNTEFRISTNRSFRDVAFCPFCAESVDCDDSFDVDDDVEDGIEDEYED